MIEKLKTGWTIQRALFTGIGGYVLWDSFQHKEWLGVFLGIYFLYMGIFAKGCASGTCYTPPKEEEIEISSMEVEWEEVK